MRCPTPPLALLALPLILACGDATAPPEETTPVEEVPSEPVASTATDETDKEERVAIPTELEPCFACHADVVTAFLEHGMADGIGPVGRGKGPLPEPGTVQNPRSGSTYRIRVDGGEALLELTTASGGRRVQRIVGRIGAGLYDTSWIGVELDPVTGEETGRLFFTPVESITGHGLELSPFELHEGSAGLDMALTHDCLTCHTETDPQDLPGARLGPDRRSVYPAHALGSDAFEHLEPFGCDTCHGSLERHRAVVTGEVEPAPSEGLGVEPLESLDPLTRRDICARCHLQGDARMELVDGRPSRERPLAGQIPVLVPARPVEEFRFVGQVEQLAKSACFRASPEMVCTTCHDPHTGVATQGPESFEAACLDCHAGLDSGHAGTTVEVLLGRPARTDGGCLDCHLERAEPADLPHVVTTDHWIRRRLPEPPEPGGHQQFLDPDGPLALFHDARLDAPLATPAGQRWERGVQAMGLVTLGRFEEAAELLEGFPPPGSPAAVEPSAPEPLLPLETAPAFHHVRALVLQAAGRPRSALAAYGDALRLDPRRSAVRLDRARLRLTLGDYRGMVEDTESVLTAHPEAERPWNLRARMGLALGRPDMAAQALARSAAAWPSNPAVWYQLAHLRRALGDDAGADEALGRAVALEPEPPAPPED